MCSDTDNLTFIQNNNLFCLHNGRNTLCNNKDGRVFGISFQRFSQFRIGFKVQRGEGIIKDDIEETIKSMGYIGRVGMRATDTEILNVMIDRADINEEC